MPRSAQQIGGRRALAWWRVLPVLAAAIVVIAVMTVVAMRATAAADRARRAQVVTQHLRGESLRVEGITWRALAGGADDSGGNRGSVHSVSSGFATYRRMLADLRELRRLGVSHDRLGPLERELGALTEAGLAANAYFDSDVERARTITTDRFSPALGRFMAETERAATAQGVAARSAQRRARVSSGGAFACGLVLLALLGWSGHRIQRAAALASRTRETERRAEARIGALVRHSSDVVAITDVDGTVRWISEPVRTLLDREPGTLLGTPIADLAHADGAARLHALLDQVTSGGTRPATETLRLATGRADAQGVLTFRDVEVVADDLRDDPDIGGVLLNLRDVSERLALQEQLRHQAFHDSLTGLPNRALFEDRLARALARARRHDLRAALVYVDVDDFKSINDSLGHEGGDELLRATAERIAATIRPEDTAARMGGDEFAVLVEDVADPAAVVAMAERIAAAVAEPLTIEGRRVTATASIGVAPLTGAADATTARIDADVALYEAKRRGRGQVVAFAPAMREQLDERLQLTADLDRAVRRDELSLAFQPIVDLTTGGVVAVEALLRWRHPARGDIPPTRFVPLAESTGQIVPIGRWVLATACAQLTRWDAELPAARALTVNVNVSTAQLHEPGFADDVAAILAEAGLAPERLTLEITESVLLDDDGGVQDRLEALKALGVTLALDDFGTGYSSLAYLRRFPVDVLKIDRSFVAGITADPERAGLVQGIVEIGRTLDLRVVIEGIEDADEVRLLQRMGSGHGQGFHFSRPVPADAVPALLTDDLLCSECP